MSAINQVSRIVADALGLEAGALGPDASMESVEAWDSLQHLGVITAIEAAFACRLSADEISELTSVERIARHLESR
jgi:acyl carrier protein